MAFSATRHSDHILSSSDWPSAQYELWTMEPAVSKRMPMQ